jgi:hypothetical protein
MPIRAGPLRVRVGLTNPEVKEVASTGKPEKARGDESVALKVRDL